MVCMRSHVGPAKNLLDFCRELPGGGGAVAVVLLPWCGGATGVLLFSSSALVAATVGSGTGVRRRFSQLASRSTKWKSSNAWAG
jgi:hypothetical protein